MEVDDVNQWKSGRKYGKGTKNDYRLIENGKTVEMQLTREKFVYFPAERLEEVQKHTWYAINGALTWYATTNSKRAGHTGKRSSLYLHRLLYADNIGGSWIDHIDRNGLNNRSNNVRSGGNGINAINRICSSNTGTLGVCEVKKEKCYRASCCRRQKNFYFIDYESKSSSLLAADSWVKSIRKEEIKVRSNEALFLTRKESEEGPAKKKMRKYCNNTSGVTGVSRTRGRYWMAQWQEVGKTKSRNFSIKKYGDAQAFEMAVNARKVAMKGLGKI